MSPQPARILLVDDEQSVQKLLSYPLRKEGYEVVPAMDGEEALERCRGQSFDLIVLDVMLPKLDGFDVCRRVRPQDDLGPPLGRLLLPRPAYDRRSHPAPAREDRTGSEGARVPLHSARRGVPLQRQMKLPLPPARSLGNKLALVFFAIIAFAFAVIFFIVVPQLQTNLEHQRVNELRRVVPAFTPT